MHLQDRYLGLLKDSLLNELYLEHEVRLFYIFAMLELRQPVDAEVVRNIATKQPVLMQAVKNARQTGQIWWLLDVNDGSGQPKRLNLRKICELSHTMVGRKRLDNVHACLDAIRRDDVRGDVVETGVWRGGVCIFMRGYLAAWEMSDRKVWVADSFEGLPAPSLPQDAGYESAQDPTLAISLEEVQDNFRRYSLLDDQVRFLKGWFRDSLPSAPIERLAILRLDGDLYESTRDALDGLYHKVSPGGFIIVDDYGCFEPCRRAVDEFRQKHGIADPLETVDWTGVFWRKSR
jgi:hypothetical protein